MATSEAEKARDEAMERAERHALKSFKERFEYVVVKYLRHRREPFTSGHVFDVLQEYFPTALQTHDYRAAGPLMLKLQKRGFIRPTGRYVKSNRKSSHCRPMREWIGVR